MPWFFSALTLSALGYWTFRQLLPWMNKWGSTQEELEMKMPNAEVFEPNGILSTHAITIDSPPEKIWPWIVQVGQNKGGFYSYSWLENLFGCRMKNTEQIIPEFQDIKVGDKVLLHPKAPPLVVSYVDPGKALALEGWYFYLKPLGKSRTRLLTRCYDWKDPNRKYKIAEKIFTGPAFDIAHWIMEQKMMKQIKRLAEQNK